MILHRHHYSRWNASWNKTLVLECRLERDPLYYLHLKAKLTSINLKLELEINSIFKKAEAKAKDNAKINKTEC